MRLNRSLVTTLLYAVVAVGAAGCSGADEPAEAPAPSGPVRAEDIKTISTESPVE